MSEHLEEEQCYAADGGRLAVVTYGGRDREPIDTALTHLENIGGWTILDCPLMQWRSGEKAVERNYLDAAVEIFLAADCVLFWYHSLSAVELAYLRAKTAPRVAFFMFTWDDPYDWSSPWQNTAKTQRYYDGVLSCCREAVEQMYTVPCCYCPPGFVERYARAAMAEHSGPDRFVCDVCILCTNLYEDETVYPGQKINRKALVDALCADKDISVHIYGPASFAEQYGDAYKGFAQFESTYALMRTCKVCVSTHVVSSGISGYMNERTVVAMGCGALLATDIVPVGAPALDLGESVASAMACIRSALAMHYEAAESIRQDLSAIAATSLTWKAWAETAHRFISQRRTEIQSQQQTQQQSQQHQHRLAQQEEDGTAPPENHFFFFDSFDDATTINDWRPRFLLDASAVAKRSVQFDFSVSIGSWCCAARQLAKADKRFESFPFDWIFGNLDSVVRSVPQDNCTLVLDEFLTPERARTRFSADVQSQLGFPHDHLFVAADLLKMKRRCQRWKTLLHAQTGQRRKILFLHTARPGEKCAAVLHDLARFLRALALHCSADVVPHVVSVWHRVGQADEPNELHCALATEQLTVYLANVTCEWDGDNWDGFLQQGLWDQIMQTVQVSRPQRKRTASQTLPSNRSK